MKRPVAGLGLDGFPNGPELALFEKIVGGGVKLGLKTFPGWRPLFANGLVAYWGVIGRGLGDFPNGPELTLFEKLVGGGVKLGLKMFPGLRSLFANEPAADWGVGLLTKRLRTGRGLGGFPNGPELTLFEKIVGGGGVNLGLKTFPGWRPFANELVAYWGVGLLILSPKNPCTGRGLGGFPNGPELTLFEKIVGGGVKLGSEKSLGRGLLFANGLAGNWELELPTFCPKRPVAGWGPGGFLNGPGSTLFGETFKKIEDFELPKSFSLFVEPVEHLEVGILTGRCSGSGEGVGYTVEFIVDGCVV